MNLPVRRISIVSKLSIIIIIILHSVYLWGFGKIVDQH